VYLISEYNLKSSISEVTGWNGKLLRWLELQRYASTLALTLAHGFLAVMMDLESSNILFEM
jgi:hypothetical protein